MANITWATGDWGSPVYDYAAYSIITFEIEKGEGGNKIIVDGSSSWSKFEQDSPLSKS